MKSTECLSFTFICKTAADLAATSLAVLGEAFLREARNGHVSSWMLLMLKDLFSLAVSSPIFTQMGWIEAFSP